MKDKHIKSEIHEKLNQGISKADLYDQFKNIIDDQSLKKILASRPSYELRLKFKRTHLILSIIWIFFILIELLGAFDLIVSFDLRFFISLIVSFYIAINIWKFDGRFFLPGIIWFAMTIFGSFRELTSVYQYDPDYDIFLVITAIYSSILLGGIILMYYIRKIVFSHFKWFQPEMDENDEIQFEKSTPDSI
ncbi:hypothetical protein [Salinimicrobium xinjiangense]|uniref:hypothetical protein n=1 Tax=Salinimicrobium xinjiangense TaxID=438596 RepID=UPI000426F2E9|nr:hypothetical protein [Salinimicrobium xinjiangense]